NPHWAHESGRRHTTDQPRPYPASVSLSLSLGTRHLLKRTHGRPVRLLTAGFVIAAAACWPRPGHSWRPLTRCAASTSRHLASGCLTAARVVLLAVGQVPVGPAGGRLTLARDLGLGGRRVGHLVGLGHALERELRVLAGALDVDHDDLARLELAEEDLLGQRILERPLDRAAQAPG